MQKAYGRPRDVYKRQVYMEPLTLEYIAKILRYERPDAIVPGIGGQTGLNLVMQLEKKGVLKECGTKLLGTGSASIERAEDRAVSYTHLDVYKRQDIKSGAYNPFKEIYHNDDFEKQVLKLLLLMIGECTDAFERLPLVENVEILRNILYSGVWVRFGKAKVAAGGGDPSSMEKEIEEEI